MTVIAGTSNLTQVPKLLEGAKLAFVLALRQAFASSITDVNLRYTDDKNTSKLRIYTAHPLTMEFYPAIVVSVGGGDASMTYLQEDLVDYDDATATATYAGRVSFSIGLTILTRSTLERERILDHLIIFVRHLFRDVLHGFNMEYTRNMTIGSENIIEVENKPVYEQTFDIPCFMEYSAKIDQSALDTIRSISIADIQAGILTVQ
jgi:hypothetical protein